MFEKTCILIKKYFIVNGSLGIEQQSKGILAHSLWFYGKGVCFWVVSDQSSCLACTWSGPGAFLVARVHLLATMDSSAKDSRRLVICPLLSAPPPLSWLIFRAAPHSLSGPPAVRQLMEVAIIEPGQGGHFWSVVP